jgi:type II secretory pathway pseudopilin PulG
MSMRRGSRFVSAARTRGQAAIVILLLLLGIGATLLVYNFPTAVRLSIEKDKRTEEALALAKVALIGYAASVDLPGAGRPGDLPCPDTDDDGSANAIPACAGALALGRLPWKTLGLPDLRDGDGERLWYAVSSNFKNNPRTACAAPGDAGCLNSDTRGTITVRNSAGTVIYDGTNPDAFTPSGVIAVIFSPGAVLQRQGAASAQDRSCTGAGASCTAAGVCNSAPLTDTPKCNVVNYLDILTGVEDNANFTDSSNADGFINGVIRDAAGNMVVNDRLLVITYEDLMPVLQRRVAKEVLNCLTTYASVAQNNGRYPWAAPITDVTPPYADAYDTRFGRVPDTLNNTQLGVLGGLMDLVCTLPALCMTNAWPATCGITQGTWWNNWKEMVFYGLAQPYQPADPLSLLLGVPAPGACGGVCPGPNCCLTVNPPSATADKRVVVAVAGKRLSIAAYPAGNNQPRTTALNKQDATHYLEGTNDNTATSFTYEQQPISASFSDFLLYQ